MHHDEFFTLAGGRRLAWCRYGDAGGSPLYVFHGFPGSRLQAALLHEPARRAGISLVAPDRPGFGRSAFDARRTVLSWADDVAQLADHLGHRRFGVLGISCGGAYALACAHRMPKRLDYVGLLAGMGPMDLPAIRRDQLPVLTAMFALARTAPMLAAPLLIADLLLFRGSAERAVRVLASMLSPPDRRALAADAGVAAAFGASLAEAYAGGLRGALREAHLIGRERGFALCDIMVPVHVYQGGHDRHVPPAMGRHIAETVPNGRLRWYPDEGHLSIVIRAIDDVLTDLAAARSPRHAEPTPA